MARLAINVNTWVCVVIVIDTETRVWRGCDIRERVRACKAVVLSGTGASCAVTMACLKKALSCIKNDLVWEFKIVLNLIVNHLDILTNFY